MTFFEILLIYLSLGFSFGLHYAFDNRKSRKACNLIAESILVTFVWFFYAWKLSINLLRPDERSDQEIFKLQKELEAAIIQSAEKTNLFKTREILNSYISLTLASQSRSHRVWQELIDMTNHPNPKTGLRCLQRNNHKKIRNRQKKISKMLVELILQSGCREAIEKATRIATCLEDHETALEIQFLSREFAESKPDDDLQDNFLTSLYSESTSSLDKATR